MSGLSNLFWRIPLQIRFLMAGGFNTMTGTGLVLAGQFLLGRHMPAQFVFALAWISNSITAFLIMKHLAFRSSGPYLPEYLRYISTSLSNFLLGIVILSILVDFIKVNPYLGQAMTMFINALLAYVLLQFFAFRKRS